MNKEINSNYSIESYINGLSDHDAQILVLRNINICNQKDQPAVIRQINETTITQFKLHLSEENWSSTFNPLNAELNPTCQLLALLGAHHILHISRIRANTSH